MVEKTIQQNTAKLVTAHAKSLHISPRKVRLVTNAVKNMRVADALIQLEFINKRSAPELVKLLKSAVANAENNFSLNPENLFIKSITCDMGKTMKRYFPRARGSAFIIKKKMSHVHVVLEERATGKKSTSGRLAILKRQKKATREANEPIEQESGKVADVNSVTKEKKFKTDEQVKMNRVQNKRRLFNRKSGE